MRQVLRTYRPTFAGREAIGDLTGGGSIIAIARFSISIGKCIIGWSWLKYDIVSCDEYCSVPLLVGAVSLTSTLTYF